MVDSHKDSLYQVWLFDMFYSFWRLCASFVEIHVINVLGSCRNIDYILVWILEILYAGVYMLVTNRRTGAFSLCILICVCTTGGDVFIPVTCVALCSSTEVLYFYILFCLQETYVRYLFILINWFSRRKVSIFWLHIPLSVITTVLPVLSFCHN